MLALFGLGLGLFVILGLFILWYTRQIQLYMFSRDMAKTQARLAQLRRVNAFTL